MYIEELFRQYLDNSRSSDSSNTPTGPDQVEKADLSHLTVSFEVNEEECRYSFDETMKMRNVSRRMHILYTLVYRINMIRLTLVSECILSTYYTSYTHIYIYTQVSRLFGSDDTHQRQWNLKCTTIDNMPSIIYFRKQRKILSTNNFKPSSMLLTNKINDLIDKYRQIINGYIADLKAQYDLTSSSSSSSATHDDRGTPVSTTDAYSSSSASGRNNSTANVDISTTNTEGPTDSTSSKNDIGRDKSITKDVYDAYDDDYVDDGQYIPVGGYDSDDSGWGMAGYASYQAIYNRGYSAQEVGRDEVYNGAVDTLVNGSSSSSGFAGAAAQYAPTSVSSSSSLFPIPIANSYPSSFSAFQQVSCVTVRPPMPPPRPPTTPPPSTLSTTASTSSYTKTALKKSAIPTYNPSSTSVAPVSKTVAEPVASTVVPELMEEPLGYVIDTIGQVPLPRHSDAFTSSGLYSTSSPPLIHTALPVTTASTTTLDLSPPIDDVALANPPTPTVSAARKPAKLSKQAKLDLYNASLDLYADEFEVNEQECREAYLFCINRKKIVSLRCLYLNYINRHQSHLCICIYMLCRMWHSSSMAACLNTIKNAKINCLQI